MACYNTDLGRFQLAEIPPALKGEPKIEVAFSIDINGILQVSAIDLYTGNEAGLRVESSNLSAEEVSRMIEEAKVYAAEDKRRREEVEAGIKADNMICAAENIGQSRAVDRSNGVRLEELEAKIFAVKAALSSGDSAAVCSKTKELQELITQRYKLEDVLNSASAT